MSSSRNRLIHPPAAVAAAVALAIASPLPVLAQQSAEGAALEEIIVTAQRRSESLMDVPIAVSAISAASIEKQNIRGVEDVLAEVPNVSFVSLGSRDRKEISLRGISNQLNPFVDVRSATYAFYIDEFNVAVGTSGIEAHQL